MVKDRIAFCTVRCESHTLSLTFVYTYLYCNLSRVSQDSSKYHAWETVVKFYEIFCLSLQQERTASSFKERMAFKFFFFLHNKKNVYFLLSWMCGG